MEIKKLQRNNRFCLSPILGVPLPHPLLLLFPLSITIATRMQIQSIRCGISSKGREQGCRSNRQNILQLHYTEISRSKCIILDIFSSKWRVYWRSVVPLHSSFQLFAGPIWTKILSQRAVKPKTTNQPIKSTVR